MGRVVDGKWMSEDEILAADPVAGPLGEKLQRRLDQLGEDIRSGYASNVATFRDRLRKRLEEEGR